MKRHEFIIKIMIDKGLRYDFYIFRKAGRYYLGNPVENIRLKGHTFNNLSPSLSPVPAHLMAFAEIGMQCWVLENFAKEIEKA